jgi:hypothetical protein
MLIALIDDGINATIYPELNLKYDLTVEDDGTITERDASETILTDHGTTCARIIAKYAPDAEFCSLRIFHKEKLRTSCEQLIAALEWCLNGRVPIIHMSLGSSLLSDYQQIRPIVARILRQHQVLIAAHSNNASYSIPACLSGVLGVTTSAQLTNDEYRILFSASGQPTIQASSNHRLLSLSGYEITTQITNSYAAPTITAKVHNLLSNNDPLSISSIQVFKLLSNCDIYPKYINPDFIENAVVYNPHGYPISKGHFFFSTVHVEPGAFIKSGRYDIVYLAPPEMKTTDTIWSDFAANENLYENVLYGGSIHPFQSQMGWEKFVWSEDAINNREYLTGILQNGMICPIVNIYGSDIRAIELLCELRNLFFSDGFQCGCLCDHPFAYLYGVGFVANTNNWQKAIENAMITYNPDLLINCYQKKSSPLVPFEHDEFHALIEDGYSPGIIDSAPLCNNLISLPSDFSEDDVILVYQKISRYFA